MGDEEQKRSLQMKGLNLMAKTLHIKGARIAFTIWDVGGTHNIITIIMLSSQIIGETLVLSIINKFNHP